MFQQKKYLRQGLIPNNNYVDNGKGTEKDHLIVSFLSGKELK